MNEFELQRLYETQLTAQVRNENLPSHDRTAAGVVLNAYSRLLSTKLRPEDEHRTWVFSDPHFEHEPRAHIFGRPLQSCHHADGYLFKQWTHDVRDHDTVVCLGDVTTAGQPLIDLTENRRRQRQHEPDARAPRRLIRGGRTHSSASTAPRSSIKCTALTGADPAAARHRSSPAPPDPRPIRCGEGSVNCGPPLAGVLQGAGGTARRRFENRSVPGFHPSTS